MDGYPPMKLLLINDVASNEPVIEAVWSEGPVLPDRLIDLVTEDNSDNDGDEDENEDNCDESDESDMDELD
jgi:hypothetical protein